MEGDSDPEVSRDIEAAAPSRRFRLNVRQRLLTGLLAMLMLVLAAALAAGLTAWRMQSISEEFSTRTVPALEQAATLARLGVSLDVAARALAAAVSQFESDAAVFRLRQLSVGVHTSMDALPGSVGQLPVRAEVIALANEFDQLIAELEPLVLQRINAEIENQALLRRIDKIATDSLRPSVKMGSAEALIDAARSMLWLTSSLATDDPGFARILRGRLDAEHAVLQRLARSDAPLDKKRGEAGSNNGSEGNATPDLRLAQLRMEFRIRQLRTRAAGLIEGIGRGADTIAAELRSTLAEQVANTHRQTRQVFWLLALIGLGSIGGVLWIAHDIRHHVIRRIEHLRATMRAHVDGYPRAIEIEGFDEIAEMARSVDHFAREIGQREIAAQSAHARLLDTQQQLVMQEKMAALGTLTAGVAHEINNPTNFISGSAQNLEVQIGKFREFLRELAGADADAEVLAAFDQQIRPQQEQLTNILEGAQRIKAIVGDLRQFTRLDQAEHKLMPIAEPIQSTVNLIRTRFARIQFRLNLAFNPSIECQPAKLGQMFMNLIVNACEAIERVGDSREGVVLIQTRSMANEKEIEIAVIDNGCGIVATIREHVFEPFFTTKHVGAGTGLGLAICHGIVKDHGGRIELVSTPGQGTKISVFLSMGSVDHGEPD